jgi:hypothetical protein
MILTGENRSTGRENFPTVILSTTNIMCIELKSNPGFRGDKPATNHLSRGTAFKDHLKVLLYPIFPDFRNSIAFFWMVTRLPPFVLLVIAI